MGQLILGQLLNGAIVLPAKARGRVLTATVHAVSTTELPIPPGESAIDVRVARADIAPISTKQEEVNQ